MDNQEFKIKLIKRSKSFSLDIWQYLDTLPKSSFSFTIVAKQLLRSATSVGANIVEAQGSSSKKDFINFLHYALKSANESIYWLELLLEKDKSQNNPKRLLQEANELAKILGSILISLKHEK